MTRAEVIERMKEMESQIATEGRSLPEGSTARADAVLLALDLRMAIRHLSS